MIAISYLNTCLLVFLSIWLCSNSYFIKDNYELINRNYRLINENINDSKNNYEQRIYNLEEKIMLNEQRLKIEMALNALRDRDVIELKKKLNQYKKNYIK